MIELIVDSRVHGKLSLDVDQNQVILLNKSFLSLTDIGQRKGDYSLSFSLPGTPTNNEFFGSFGDPSQGGVDWSSVSDQAAYVLEDTNIILQGSLKLERADPDLDKYQVSVSGLIFSLKYLLGDLSMAALDMSAWPITLSLIKDTWNGSVYGGHIIYSAGDFGQGYGLLAKSGADNAIVDITQNRAGGGTPITLDKTVPAFRLNELLRMIINERGLSIEGSWFSEDQCEQIYVQADGQLSSFASQPEFFTAYLEEKTIIPESPILIPFRADPAVPEFDNVSREFTASIGGTYYFGYGIYINPGTPSGLNITIDLLVNGLSIETITKPQEDNFVSSYKPVTLLAGDTFSISIQRAAGASFLPGLYTTAPVSYLALQSVNLGADEIDPSIYLANHSQIGFLREIASIFNLIIWMPDNESVRMDTYDYYMATYGSRKDWSQKVDLSSRPVVSPINSELRNPINLELKQADDVLNQEYIRAVGKSYGCYREFTPLPFCQDPADPSPIFAPMPVQPVLSSDPTAEVLDMLIAKYYNNVDSLSYSPPGLQLAYYNGARITSEIFYTEWYEGGPENAGNIYPYFAPWRLYQVDGYQIQEDSLDLNFTWYDPPYPSIVDTISQQGLFNRYFKNMLRQRYAEGSKVIEFQAVLSPNDVANFDFADEIIITLNGTPVGLQLLDIKNYSPTRRAPVKIKALILY